MQCTAGTRKRMLWAFQNISFSYCIPFSIFIIEYLMFEFEILSHVASIRNTLLILILIHSFYDPTIFGHVVIRNGGRAKQA